MIIDPGPELSALIEAKAAEAHAEPYLWLMRQVHIALGAEPPCLGSGERVTSPGTGTICGRCGQMTRVEDGAFVAHTTPLPLEHAVVVERVSYRNWLVTCLCGWFADRVADQATANALQTAHTRKDRT